MDAPKKTKITIFSVIKIVLGVIGILAIALGIVVVTPAGYDYIVDKLVEWNYEKFDTTDRMVTSLSSFILGILFIFIAFSKQIDKFFTVMENKEIKLNKKNENGGVTVESIFFAFIGLILVVLAVLMGIDKLTIRGKLPVLKGATEPVLLTALIVLALVAFVTAFNRIIMQSLKELKKVHWPTKEQMTKFSAQVFAFIIFFSLLFFVLDILIDLGISSLL